MLGDTTLVINLQNILMVFDQKAEIEIGLISKAVPVRSAIFWANRKEFR